jgi:hypothetical protein
MYPTTRYIMCDQVRDLVPTLCRPQSPRLAFTLRNWLELSVFLLAISCYIVALSLVA